MDQAYINLFLHTSKLVKKKSNELISKFLEEKVIPEIKENGIYLEKTMPTMSMMFPYTPEYFVFSWENSCFYHKGMDERKSSKEERENYIKNSEKFTCLNQTSFFKYNNKLYMIYINNIYGLIEIEDKSSLLKFFKGEFSNYYWLKDNKEINEKVERITDEDITNFLNSLIDIREIINRQIYPRTDGIILSIEEEKILEDAATYDFLGTKNEETPIFFLPSKIRSIMEKEDLY